MIVSINQPAYLPWLGYFHRIATSDLHIVLDHVQYEKNSFVNRNKVCGKDGPVWLTVPLLTSGKFGELPIHSLEFAPNQNWQKKHWSTLQNLYRRTPFFDHYAPAYEAIYAAEWDSFAPMVDTFLRQHLNDLGINTPLLKSSEMQVDGKKSDLVLNLCQNTGATVYLSGALGRNYLDEESFRANGIQVEYQDYRHPVYPQPHPDFTPYMCILDLLFNQGPASRDILLQNQSPT
jgi:hypothetical protein